MRILHLVAVLLTTSLLTAQGASYTLFGTACSTGRLTEGLGPVPLSVEGVPRLGTTFRVLTEPSVRYAWGNRRIVHLMTGLSNQSSGALALPFDVTMLNLGGPTCGLLLTSSEGSQLVPSDPSHLATVAVSIAIPNQPALAGLVFYQQVASAEYSSFGPPSFALQLSAGGRGVVGF